MAKLVEFLAGGLERGLAFAEHVAEVKREAEEQTGQSCEVLYFNAPEPDESTPLLVVVGGRIRKKRQERIPLEAIGGKA